MVQDLYLGCYWWSVNLGTGCRVLQGWGQLCSFPGRHLQPALLVETYKLITLGAGPYLLCRYNTAGLTWTKRRQVHGCNRLSSLRSGKGSTTAVGPDLCPCPKADQNNKAAAQPAAAELTIGAVPPLMQQACMCWQ